MKTADRHSARTIIIVTAFAVMLLVNILANALSLNGLNTGEVSNLYPNLFAPVALTFSIWGVIYVLLLLYVLYLLGALKGGSSSGVSLIETKVENFFIVSCFANAGWILAWQYRLIPLSMLLMVVILVCLIGIYQSLATVPLGKRERLLVKLPFSVYYAWITIATCANLMALCVSLGWDGMGASAPLWTSALLTLGLVVGLATILRYRDIAYSLVFIWAYAGILVKHVSGPGFSGAYPLVIYTTCICLVVLVVSLAYILSGAVKRKASLTD